MVQGKCPHPWNKTKKGSFSIGHAQVNEGKGQFEPGRELPEEVRVLNSTLGKERYTQGTHPFNEANIRAHKYRNLYSFYGIGKTAWKELTSKVYRRDNWTCQSCNKDLHNARCDCHHIVPFAFGGSNSEENLITLCVPCHASIEYFSRKALEGEE